jgi:hypothetical protein
MSKLTKVRMVYGLGREPCTWIRSMFSRERMVYLAGLGREACTWTMNILSTMLA